MEDRRSGLQLSEDFYRDVVRPALTAEFPDLQHAAALMGRGSEVLGFDDAMSADHDWSARVNLLLDATDTDLVEPVQSRLSATLPSEFEGVQTKIEVATLTDYFRTQLGLDITRSWDACDWLSIAEHRLCSFTSGAVFHDQIGLREVRDRLSYYPRDVWLYLISAAWWRIHPEMNVVGRSGYAGDDVGSALVAAEMVDGLMHLSFLIERRYAPYRKWRGSAFARLDLAGTLLPELQRVLNSRTWQERERGLNAAYKIVVDACNALQLSDPVPMHPVRLWDRPFTVTWADFPSALMPQIRDAAVQSLGHSWPPASGVDQIREILWAPKWRPAVRELAAHTRD